MKKNELIFNDNLTLNAKIKSILFFIGINEKYVAFDYLTSLLSLLTFEDFNKLTYKQSINSVMKIYNIAHRTLTQGLSKILKTCTEKNITTKRQFIMKSNGTFNKICVVKNYVCEHLNNTNNIYK